MFPKYRCQVTVTAVMLVLLTIGGQWPEARADSTQHPEVKVGRTTFRGVSHTVEGGKKVSKFLGIRYAKPPVGARRFQQPTAADLPRGTVNANSYKPRCPQMVVPGPGTKSLLYLRDIGMAEDCLFLNVFQPENADNLPVLVWIHGGGFNIGAADMMEGEFLAAETDVVVVTVAYRLGVLGFLSTGDDEAAGNYGLWDQRLALQWVQKYIKHFGGDEGKVTVAGHSAGAVSASLLSLSPKSRDFFQQVILMSGSAHSPWGRVTSAQALETSKRLGHILDCDKNHNITSQALIACLRKHTFEELVTAGTDMYRNQVGLSLITYTWVPVVDGDLVKEKATSFPGPLLIGVSNDEGTMLTEIAIPKVSLNIPDIGKTVTKRQVYKEHLLPSLMKQELPDLVPLPYPAIDSPDPEAYLEPPYINALNRLECVYNEGKEGSNTTTVGKAEIREVYGDQAFLVGTVRYLKQFSNFQLSYLYYFDHQTARPGLPTIGHGDELPYVFGFNFTLARTVSAFTDHVTDMDLQLARDFRKLLSNFMKTGNPNPRDPPDGWPEWKPYTPMGAYYLKVSPQPELLSHLKARKMELWIEELPEILRTADNRTAEQQCTISNGSGHLNLRGISDAFVQAVALVLLCVRLLLW